MYDESIQTNVMVLDPISKDHHTHLALKGNGLFGLTVMPQEAREYSCLKSTLIRLEANRSNNDSQNPSERDSTSTSSVFSPIQPEPYPYSPKWGAPPKVILYYSQVRKRANRPAKMNLCSLDLWSFHLQSA